MIHHARPHRPGRLPPATAVPAPVDGACTRATSRCPNARSYAHVLNPCCRGHLRTLVADAVAAFTQFGVPYWADYGTILGAVRNPLTTRRDYPWLDQAALPEGPLPAGIIPHDKDADFGVYWKDWQRLLRAGALLERQGYNVIVRHHSASIKIRLSEANHTNLDVFSWHERTGGRLERRRYISVDHYKGREFPIAWLRPLSEVAWEGLTLTAPTDPEAFCAFRYGPNWRTPVNANHDGVRR